MFSFMSPEDLQVHFETAHIEPLPSSGVSLTFLYLFLSNWVEIGEGMHQNCMFVFRTAKDFFTLL